MSDQNKEYWIPVTVSEGMFSTEYAIMLKLASGENVSFFVDKDLVKTSGNDCLLRVLLVSADPNKNRKRVLLPTETFETASRWVEVAA
jgi:hypothetical protein